MKGGNIVRKLFLITCIMIIFSGCTVPIYESTSKGVVDSDSSFFVNTVSKSQDNYTDCYETSETEKYENQEINIPEGKLVYTDDIELHSISGDLLDLPLDYKCNENLNIVAYNEMSFILTSFNDTYTSIHNPDKFMNSKYIGKSLKGNTEFKSIYLNDTINRLTVCSATYSHAFTLSSDGDIVCEYPSSASMRLEGEVTLTGILTQAQKPSDYGYSINGNNVMFFPYASSLNESDFPSLHSEIIDAVFFSDRGEEISFYGETLPFELDCNDELQNLLSENKTLEIEVTLSNIEQEWYYGNGSGYLPCSAEVINFTSYETIVGN